MQGLRPLANTSRTSKVSQRSWRLVNVPSSRGFKTRRYLLRRSHVSLLPTRMLTNVRLCLKVLNTFRENSGWWYAEPKKAGDDRVTLLREGITSNIGCATDYLKIFLSTNINCC